MEANQKPGILCVDDEPNVLEGLALHLRRRYEVFSAISGAQGLELLAQQAGIAVVISDMRMPGMDGAAFLGQVRRTFPDTVRLLLTGQAELGSAIRAVNDGQLFRFLTKPCAPPDLLATVEAAVQQHRLVTSERVLLEQTLHGSIRALTDVLALTNPLCFGRATRIKTRVTELAKALALEPRWQVEVAAMLSQLGCITLPHEVVEKLYYGKPVGEGEQAMVDRLPEVTEKLLGNIPRLEVVRAILALAALPPGAEAGASASEAGVRRCAELLRLVSELDVLEAQGQATARALETLRARPAGSGHDRALIEAAARLYGQAATGEVIRELKLDKVVVGMVFVEDVLLRSGTLLAARGFEVTESFLERARNYRRSLKKDLVRVSMRNFNANGVRAA
jgi:response regulator RpfG family c-di-GMP phosphodiesterase